MSGEVVRIVEEHDTALFLGSGDLPVLGTPALVALLEQAACQALIGAFPPETTSVGTRIDVRHRAASPVGVRVAARATVTQVDGARITFDVAAEHERDGQRITIATGTHVRAIVDRHGFLEDAAVGHTRDRRPERAT